MKKLFNNTLASLMDYAVLVALNLVATPLLIKYFGVDGYGAFVFLSIFSIYGALSFFDLGMEGSLMNYVPRMVLNGDRRMLQDTLVVSVGYYGLIGIILGLVFYACGGFIAARLLHDNTLLSRSSVFHAITIISLMIFVQFLTVPFTAILQGMRRFVVTKGLSVAMNILRYALVVFIAVETGRIDYAFMIILGLTVIRLIALLVIFVFNVPQFRGIELRFNFPLLRTLMSYTSLLFVYRLIGLVHNQIDKVLIWLYLLVSNMTVYDVVVRPANILRLVLTILNSAVIPEVAHLQETDDYDAIKRLYIRLVRFAYLILLPVLAGLYVFVDILLRLWVGDRFVPYAHLSVIILSVYLLLPFGSVASTMVVGLERIRQTIWIPITATIINVILSLALLRWLGLAGLLVGTLVADLFAAIPYLRFMKRMLRFGIMEIVRPIAAIFAVAAAAAGGYVGVRTLMTGMPYVQTVAAVAVFAANILVNYRLLLTENEKSFFKDFILRRSSA